MEAARPRKVLGLRDAVGITGDEDGAGQPRSGSSCFVLCLATLGGPASPLLPGPPSWCREAKQSSGRRREGATASALQQRPHARRAQLCARLSRTCH